MTQYTRSISERRSASGALVYPRRLIDGRDAPDATRLLRETLASQSDGSVVVVQVGYSSNLARLLESRSDASSELSGHDLVARKVRLLSVMGGCFADVTARGVHMAKGGPEFNLSCDLEASQRLFSEWPTEIVASGFEVGLTILYPGRSIDREFNYAQNHPIAEAYRTACKDLHLAWPHDQTSFDLTAVLYAARPDNGYFSLSPPGRIQIDRAGKSLFEELPSGRHRYLIAQDAEKARVVEAMTLLASQPPRCLTAHA